MQDEIELCRGDLAERPKVGEPLHQGPFAEIPPWGEGWLWVGEGMWGGSPPFSPYLRLSGSPLSTVRGALTPL